MCRCSTPLLSCPNTKRNIHNHVGGVAECLQGKTLVMNTTKANMGKALNATVVFGTGPDEQCNVVSSPITHEK